MLHTQAKQVEDFPSNSFKSQAVVRTIYKKPWASQSQADHFCCPRHPTLVVVKMKKLWPLNFRRLLHCKRLTLFTFLLLVWEELYEYYWIFSLMFYQANYPGPAQYVCWAVSGWITPDQTFQASLVQIHGLQHDNKISFVQRVSLWDSGECMRRRHWHLCWS